MGKRSISTGSGSTADRAKRSLELDAEECKRHRLAIHKEKLYKLLDSRPDIWPDLILLIESGYFDSKADAQPDCLHRWLGALMLRPHGHWLLDQLVPAIAAVIDRHWDVAVDIFAPLQKSIAQYAHRCDPALRRAAFVATRAKQGSQKLSRAAKVLGKSASLRNRLHMHCEMHCYFMEFRRVFSSSVQLAVAPDDSRFHGKAYCMSPVQDLVTGIMGWLPPKAQALEQ